MKATYPVRSAIVISIGGLSSRRRTCRTTQPTPILIAMPPVTLATNASPTCATEKPPVTTATTATR